MEHTSPRHSSWHCHHHTTSHHCHHRHHHHLDHHDYRRHHHRSSMFYEFRGQAAFTKQFPVLGQVVQQMIWKQPPEVDEL